MGTWSKDWFPKQVLTIVFLEKRRQTNATCPVIPIIIAVIVVDRAFTAVSHTRTPTLKR